MITTQNTEKKDLTRMDRISRIGAGTDREDRTRMNRIARLTQVTSVKFCKFRFKAKGEPMASPT